MVDRIRRNLPKIDYRDNNNSSSGEDEFLSPGAPSTSPRRGRRPVVTDKVLKGVKQVLESRLDAELPLEETIVQAKMVKYDEENKDDGEDYYKRTGNIKLPWDPDVKYWFNSFEAQMKQAQVFKQWTKREILQTHIPDHVRDEVRYLLRLDEDEAGTTPYLDIKKAIIKLFAPKAHEGLDKALGRVLTTRPSQLTKQIIEDICQCKPALNCPCCANIVYGISRRQFPTAVRNQIAKMKFDKDSYLEVLDHADEVFVSDRGGTSNAAGAVAAVAGPSVTNPNQVVAEVAAVGRGGYSRGARGGQRGNRGGRGNNRGGNNTGTTQASSASGGAGSNRAQRFHPNPGTANKGPRHPDLPPNQSCQTHWTYGKSATFCRKPFQCPWKEFISNE